MCGGAWGVLASREKPFLILRENASMSTVMAAATATVSLERPL